MAVRPIGKNRLKRNYVVARDFYMPLSRTLHELRRLCEHLPAGMLDPATDFMMDKVDVAEKPYRAALEACVARGITKAYAYRINKSEIEDEANGDD